MLKMILNDYRMDFKENWKNTISASNALLLMFYSFWVPFMQIDTEENMRLTKVIIHGLFFLLVFLGIAIGEIYPNKLGKMYCLLPVSTKEKKRYLLMGYCIRVFVTMVVLTGYMVGMAIVGLLEWQLGIFMWFVLLFFFLLNNTYTKRANKKDAMGEIMSAAHWVGVIFGITLCFIWMGGDYILEPLDLFGIAISAVCFFVLVTATVAAMYKCWKEKREEITKA